MTIPKSVTLPVRELIVGGLFLMSSLLGAVTLSACDNSSATSVTQAATPGQDSGSAVSRGQAVYARYCNTCHPGGGRGSGPSLIQLAPVLSDDRLRAAVRNGKNRMPAYGEVVISNDSLSDMVAYMRSLK